MLQVVVFFQPQPLTDLLDTAELLQLPLLDLTELLHVFHHVDLQLQNVVHVLERDALLRNALLMLLVEEV